MGFRISWIAAKGMPKAQLLRRLELRDTGVVDEANEAEFSVTELPTGWTILWANDPTFAKIALCQPLSSDAPILSCWINETVMFASANYFENGEYRWFVGHNAQEAVDNLEWDGTIPPEFNEIRDRLHLMQEENGGADSDVDFYFDIPLELAQSICGFKHDLCDFSWGSPSFTAVEKMSATMLPPSSAAPAERKSWFDRIFGRH